jgi:hypothetical protein
MAVAVALIAKLEPHHDLSTAAIDQGKLSFPRP